MTQLVDPVDVIKWFVLNGNMYILGFEGRRGAPFVPETNPHPSMCPLVVPFNQN